LALAAAIDNLPEEQRDVLIQRDLNGAPVSQIAEQLGRTEKSVAGLLLRSGVLALYNIGPRNCGSGPDFLASEQKPGFQGRNRVDAGPAGDFLIALAAMPGDAIARSAAGSDTRAVRKSMQFSPA
jgi:hypothetical protein